MFALLALQNAAGLWINLYVVVLDTSSYSGVYPAMFATVAGATHTVIGVLIGINAILTLLVARRFHERRLWGVAAIALALVAVAAYSGFHFVQSGGDNAYSFLMEMSFVGVVLCEAALLYFATMIGVRPGFSPTAPGPESS